MRSLLFFFGAALTWAVVTQSAWAGDWPRFRGPNGAALSEDRDTPLKWGPSENVVWRTQLPGPGSSSPITTAGKVLLTCFTGYGVDRQNPGTPDKLERILVCLDESTGKILWQRPIKAVAGEDRLNGMLQTHGFASSTPATDGDRVYVLFGKQESWP